MESKMNVLNRIFTRNMLRSFVDGENEVLFDNVVRRYISDPTQKVNRELISELYNMIKNNYRNEYYYKNTLLNKLLLGVHSVNTTTVLTELPVARSKADFIMINGRAVVYEIKTELDNLDRLAMQIEDYYKAFDHVMVITYENNVENTKRVLTGLPNQIGISVLKSNGKISIIRKAEEYSQNLDSKTIFKILRKNEYENIISKYYGKLPNTTQFEYFQACLDKVVAMPIEVVYKAFLEELKKRIRIDKDELERIPYELRFQAYFMNLSNYEYEHLNSFLDCQYGGV